MIYLISLFIAGFLGFAVMANLLINSSVRNKALLAGILSLPVGLAVISLLLFVCYVVSIKNAPDILYLAVLLLIIWMGIRLHRHDFFTSLPKSLISKAARKKNAFLGHIAAARNDPKALVKFLPSFFSLLLFLVVLALFAQLFLHTLVWKPYGGGDANYIWKLKAKFFFRSPEDWKLMFSPLLFWSHPDYPLLHPGMIAWGWITAGQEIMIWPILTIWIFAFSSGLLLIWHFRSQQRGWIGFFAAAFLLSMPAYLYWTYQQYTDIVLCFFVLCSVTLLLRALRTLDKSIFFLTGLMAGCAIFTKLEGIFFAGWITLAAVAAIFRIPDSIQQKKSLFLFFLLGMLIPGSAYLIQKIGFAGAGEYWGSGRSVLDYIYELFSNFKETQLILMSFVVYMFHNQNWNYLWYFFVAACLYRAFFLRESKSKAPDYGWIPAQISLFILFGYFLILHVTPYNLSWQIATAFDRLLLHAAMPALLFIFETFDLEEFPLSRKKDRTVRPAGNN